MRFVVVDGPAPIITPADVPGDHDGDDARMAALIAAAQAEIDGPTGWLGRALGVQTIECHTDRWPRELPYHPVIELVSTTVDSEPVAGVQLRNDGRLVVPGAARCGEIVIRYRAGYDEETTGKVPANAKAAVMLAVNVLRSMSEGDVFAEAESVNGIGSETRKITTAASETIERTIRNLLAPLQVYA